MRKIHFVIAITTVALSVLFSSSLCTAAKMPDLKGVGCGAWVSYEDDTVYALNYYYREKGMSLMKEDEENALRKSAYVQKLAYVQGLLDAYAQVFEISNGEAFNYSFKSEEYIAGIDEFCGDKLKNDQKIVFVMARVNKELKK
jgi:hypothetical protein